MTTFHLGANPGISRVASETPDTRGKHLVNIDDIDKTTHSPFVSIIDLKNKVGASLGRVIPGKISPSNFPSLSKALIHMISFNRY